MRHKVEEREARKERGKAWFLHHRARRFAIVRLQEADEAVEAASSGARQAALFEHWRCWEKLRAIEEELALRWDRDTFPSRRRRRGSSSE